MSTGESCLELPFPSSLFCAIKYLSIQCSSTPTDEPNRESELPEAISKPEIIASEVPLTSDQEHVENNLSAVADNSEVAAAMAADSADSAAVGGQVEENNNNASHDVALSSEAQVKATTTSPAQDVDPSSADAQIESAIEVETTSVQPPIVSATESDLRENPTPVKQEEAASLQEEKRELDALNDSDLARTTQDTDTSQAIERPLSPATSADEVDQVKASASPEPKPQQEDFAFRQPALSQLDINAQSPRIQSQGPASTMDISPMSQRGNSDTEMTEAPQMSSAKHSRDEDPAEESAAKRSKTESPSQNGLSEIKLAGDDEDNLPITQYQIKELRKSIRAAKSTLDGRNFKGPVVDLWPAIKDLYLQKVANPIDLTIIEKRLNDTYKTMAEYKSDIYLLYQNCIDFNGPDHDVSRSGLKVRDALLAKIPPREVPKAPPRKKGQALRKEAAPVHERRVPYQGTGHGNSPHPPAAAQTFALDPSGTPLIRRDSTKMDGGRPKRDIHPPKPRDIAYNARPKKKKYATELRFCETVLDEMKRPKYIGIASPFLHPVDPVALGIPEYFKFIKNPMDLGTVADNLRNGHYETAKHFEADIRLIFKNCYKFNPEGTPVNAMGHELEAVFDDLWAGKNSWVEKHSISAQASPDSSAESAAEESEEEEEVEDTDTSKTTALMQARLVDEQQKLIDIMSSGGDQALIRMQSEMVEIVKKQIADFVAANQSKKKKPKAKAPSKKAAPPKKSSKLHTGNKPYKIKHIGQMEKEQISAGITQLEGKPMETAINYLKKDIPHLNLEEDPELDIDQFSNETLSRLHDLIQRHCPQVIPPPEPRAPRPQKPVKPKKNKPMSKHEQEKKIQQLRELEQKFKRQGSTSDDAKLMPCKYTSNYRESEFDLQPSKFRWLSGVEHWLTHISAVEHDQMSSSGDESPSDSEED